MLSGTAHGLVNTGREVIHGSMTTIAIGLTAPHGTGSGASP